MGHTICGHCKIQYKNSDEFDEYFSHWIIQCASFYSNLTNKIICDYGSAYDGNTFKILSNDLKLNHFEDICDDCIAELIVENKITGEFE